ncbi:MAG: hypothetical protein ABJA37_00225 [Ferruginibacter sp.]
MKKIFILSALFIYSFTTFSQSLDDIGTLVDKKKYAEAKTGIDKFFLDAKNADNANAWYYKGRIYNFVSYDSTLSKNEKFTLKSNAFEAFKKYQQLDTKDIRMKFENYASYLDLYGGTYDLGAQQFNDKAYANALETFKKANEIKDYILNKQYTYNQVTLNTLDTALVLNIAIAALQAKNEDQSVFYFKKLADANVTGKDYAEVYEYLADYYSKKTDAANLQQILDKGKKFYPQDGYWNELELKAVNSKTDKTALFAKYEEMLSKSPNDFTLAYNYSIELYNSIYGQDVPRPADVPAAKDKLTSVLKTAITNDTGIDATTLMVNHLFNSAADYSAAATLIKSVKPEDVKKKAALKALSIKKMDECIPYAETAVKYYGAQQNLKAIQKASYQNILGYLSDMYNAKGDAKKAAEYDKTKATIKF